MRWVLSFVCLFSCFQVVAQSKVITGFIKDQHSNEPVPFASVSFKKSGIGKLADSSGTFSLSFQNWQPDTLEITSVGYEDYRLPIPQFPKDTMVLGILLIPGKYNVEVVVRKKVNRGLQMWRRIVAHKAENDRYRFRNFSYELYNKLELDLKNINKDKLSQTRLLRPFNYIFDNVDTLEGAAVLPVYLTEAVSDYYYQKNPLRRREVFKGVKTMGIQNESVARLLGGMDQNVNFYNNFIAVFDKQFVSPISDNGDAYYNYKVADTQYVGGRRLIHFLFAPKRKGENTFEGDCWVHDTTYAIQKMSLRLDRTANINFVNKLSLIQEYSLINDSTWFLSKDKFVVDINPISSKNIAFIGRKTTTYKNVVVNDASVSVALSKNKRIEETILPEGVTEKNEAYWSESRHEQLSTSEQSIYNMIDTLLKDERFIRYTNIINFLGTGYGNVGNFQIGPWQNWVSSNTVEGLRLRFDLGTNGHFDKKVIFHGYAAYGFLDKKWKGEFDVMYLFNKQPRSFVYASYLNDFDYGQSYYDEISSDNIFALAIRKQNVPIKFIKLEEKRVDGFKEWSSGFSVMATLRHRIYDPVRNLPGKENFTVKQGDPMTTFESSVRLRYAYLEKFLENNFYRTSLGSPLPILELRYTKGIRGILQSGYDYHKLTVSISNYRKIPPIGSLYFNVFGGRSFGTLPYTFLDVAPGNEMYYYNTYAFNMMNRYQYIHDRYTGVNLEHNFGNGIFRFLALTRKMKLRQFWTAKALWGNLSAENQQLNFINGYNFESLSGKTYMELGTGVDNIFRVFRLDFIWRPLPQSRSLTNNDRFGVFGSFRFAF